MNTNLKFTEEAREKFLRALRETGVVAAACAAAGITRPTAENYRKAYPDFAEAWEDAKLDAADALEEEARRRAVMGVERVILYKGDPVGTKTHYSDSLLLALLKANNPNKFRENSSLELTGRDGGPVQLSDHEKAAKLAAILNAAKVRKDAEGLA